MTRSITTKAITALLLVFFLLSQPVATHALEKQGNGYTVVDRREYPIIFIPGMAGSTLDVGGGDNAWPGSLSTNDEAFKVLALKEDGKSPLYGTRAIATDTVRYGLGDVYMIAGDQRRFPISQGFYDYMEKEGYKLNQNPSGKVFFDFPYDFRQENKRWTKLLDKKVDQVLKQTKSDKVILVGHSMGGLQARLYMKEEKRAKKVAAVVFMGTPHHGAPMAFYSFTEGYNFQNSKLSDARMWEIAGNWEGGYQLLPDYAFLVDANEVNDPSARRVGIATMSPDAWIANRSTTISGKHKG